MDSHTAGSDAASGRVALRVPGEDRFLELLRGVVGRAARISGFSFSGIEDFSLAVDEAAVLLLEHQPTDIDLHLEEVGETGDRLVAIVSLNNPAQEWPPTRDLGTDMRWQVLNALCEQVWVVDGESPGIGLAQSIR